MSATASAPNARAPRVVALMGSYRVHGTIDTLVSTVLAGAREAGAETVKIDLVEQHIDFCRNCRTCCREPGAERGACVIEDDVDGILKALENADAVVLGAPVNFGDVNALTRALLERMIGYAHWSFDMKCPQPRAESRNKPAVLVTSSAAPSFLTRIAARPLRTLRHMAKLLGARPSGVVLVGLAGQPDFRAPERAQRKARRLGRELVRRCRAAEPSLAAAGTHTAHSVSTAR